MNLLITGGAGFIGSNLIQDIIEQPSIKRLVNLDCLTYAGHLCNLESVKTYEGTDHIHALVIGERVTGVAAYK